MKDVRDVRQFLGLLLDGPDDARMRMPEAGHRQPAEEIEVTVAFGVVEIRAISPHKREWKASIGIGQALVRESDDFRVIHRADLLFDFLASRPPKKLSKGKRLSVPISWIAPSRQRRNANWYCQNYDTQGGKLGQLGLQRQSRSDDDLGSFGQIAGLLD